MDMQRFRNLTFVAIDGEGITVGREHYYNLMVVRCNQTGEEIRLTPFEGENRLTTSDIFYVLTHLPRKDRVYVMFSFGYDVTKWIEDFTEKDKLALWQGKTMLWHDKEFDLDYRVTFLPGKFFKLEEYFEGKWRRITIYDTFAFFQTAFATAIDKKHWDVGTQQEQNFIAEMKSQRSEFKLEDADVQAEYCALECDFLCRLMEKLRDALADENIIVNSWYGAGSIGHALLRKYNMGSYIQSPSMEKFLQKDRIDNAIMGAYFGGRFELMRQGVINESHQYDINSAYPYAMLSIPDFSECDVEFTREYITWDNAPFALWFVTYDVKDGKETPLFGPLPFRKQNGTVLYPYSNKHGVWVHAIELSTAMECYGSHHFKIKYGYIFHPRTSFSTWTYPFQWIKGIAEHRLEMKRREDLRNVVLKLGLNSLYGKLAQGSGHTDKKPEFQNYYLAGYVTAHCRAQLLNVAFTCGDRGSGVIQFATDGIFSTVPSDVLGTNSSEQLGEWEYKHLGYPVCYIQPGVYFSETHTEEEEKDLPRRTRGFRKSRLRAEDVFNAWANYNGIFQTPDIEVDDTRFIGIGGCVVTGKWNNYGKWVSVKHSLSLDSPPTKSYFAGNNLAWGNWNWTHRLYNVFGISSREIIDPISHYYVLVANDELVMQVSEPYPKKKQIQVILQNIDDFARMVRLFDTEALEQGDYERIDGFDNRLLGF